jgi:hypothetical protein
MPRGPTILRMAGQDSGEEEPPPSAQQEGRRLTKEALAKGGYAVVGEEIRIRLPNGERVIADMVAEREGQLVTAEAKGSAKGKERGDWLQRERRGRFEQLGGVMYGRKAREVGLEGVHVPPGTRMIRLYWNTTTKEAYEWAPGGSFPRP